MSETVSAQRRRQPAVASGSPATDEVQGALDQVVRLFADGGGDAAPAEPPDDWSASLGVVRGVAAKVREMHRSAQGTVREARRATREAEIQTQAAEERARRAEAATRDAVARAELAEERAWAAEERADAADARAAEARAWLKRMHDCMVAEFGALSGDDGHDG